MLIPVHVKTVHIFKQSKKDKIDHARLSDDESQKPSSRAGQGIRDLNNQSFVSHSLVHRSSFFTFFQGGCHWTIPNISFCLYDLMQNPRSQGSVEIANATTATVLALMSTIAVGENIRSPVGPEKAIGWSTLNGRHVAHLLASSLLFAGWNELKTDCLLFTARPFLLIAQINNTNNYLVFLFLSFVVLQKFKEY